MAGLDTLSGVSQAASAGGASNLLGSGLIGAAGNILSGVLDSLFGGSAAKQEYKYAKKLQSKAYSYSRQFRATAAEDLRSQDLNPILAAGAVPQGGTGFSVGAPSQTAGRVGSLGESAVTSAKGLQKHGAEKRILEAQVKSAELQPALMHADIGQKAAQGSRDLRTGLMHEENARLMKTQGMGVGIDNVIKQTTVPSAKAFQEFDETKPGKVLRQIRRFFDSGLTRGR